MHQSTRKIGTFIAASVLGVSALAFSFSPHDALSKSRQGSDESKGKAVILASHRAIYKMSMDQSITSSVIADVVGKMVLEFQGSECEGYTLNRRLANNISDTKGEALITDTRSSTWEKGNGKRFRFYSSEYYNNSLSEEINGDAYSIQSAPHIAVKLTKPDSSFFQLEKDTLFPTQFSKVLLKAAQSGKNIIHAKLYTGSSARKEVLLTTAFISKKTPAGSGEYDQDIKNAKVLDGLASWHIAISYFDETSHIGEVLPAHEMSFRLYENGISSTLKINYGKFTLKGKLSEIEIFKPTKCH